MEAAATASSLLCADFGSMGKMGLLSHPAHLVAVLAAAMSLVGAHCILLTGRLEVSSGLSPPCMAGHYSSAYAAPLVWFPLVACCKQQVSPVRFFLPSQFRSKLLVGTLQHVCALCRWLATSAGSC